MKTFLITGGTRGIGFAAARRLGRGGARLIIASRDAGRGTQARDAIRSQAGAGQGVCIRADLSLLTECERLAREVEQLADRLDGLIHCAGVVAWERRATSEGFEEMFATNYLARYYLSRRLLGLLRRAPAGRIVLVEATPPKRQRIDFEDLQSSRRFSAMGAMRQAQLAEHLLAQELARREGPDGVGIDVVHPRFAATEIQRGAPKPVRFAVRLLRPLMQNPEQAAENVVPVATRAGVPTGEVWPNSKRFDVHAPIVRDGDLAARMWRETEGLIDARMGDPWAAAQPLTHCCRRV